MVDSYVNTNEQVSIDKDAAFARRDSRLLKVTALWVFLGAICGARLGDWLSSDFDCAFYLAAPAWAILFVALGIALIRRSIRGRMSHRVALCWLILFLSLFASKILPSNPAWLFRQHREEFIAAVEQIKAGAPAPESQLYRSTWEYTDWFGDMVVEFRTGDFYLPLVYIASNKPEWVYDTCANGGFPVEKLETCWYVCKRDWN